MGLNSVPPVAAPAVAERKCPALPTGPRTLEQAEGQFNSASTGQFKKVVGGLGIAFGSLAVIGVVAAIVVPFFVEGAPNILSIGKNLGNGLEAGGNAVNFSVTTGALVAGGTALAGAILLIGGSVLVSKGRKEAQAKEDAKIVLQQWQNSTITNNAKLAVAAGDRAEELHNALELLQGQHAQLQRANATNYANAQTHFNAASAFYAQLQAASIAPAVPGQVPPAQVPPPVVLQAPAGNVAPASAPAATVVV